MRSAILILALGIGGRATAAEIRYFPDHAFSERADVHQFAVQWYGQHLRAMKEPSLFEASVDPSDGESVLWIADQDPQPHANVEAFLNADARRTMILTVADGIEHERVLHVDGFSPKGLRDALNAAIARSRDDGPAVSTPA